MIENVLNQKHIVLMDDTCFEGISLNIHLIFEKK